MTDFELNKAIASKYLPCDYVFDEERQAVDLVGVATKLGGHGEPFEEQVKYGEFNPVGNWNDLIPLVIEHKINLTCHSSVDIFTATAAIQKDGSFIEPSSINPQRALAECLLKVLESKND